MGDEAQAPRAGVHNNHPPPTLNILCPMNEMEVLSQKNSGSLSKFLHDVDTYRRKSLVSQSPEGLVLSIEQNTLNLTTILDMDVDVILEILDDSESEVRSWLMLPDTIIDVIETFIASPSFEGEPHDEYGYYKNYFICSEIIMRLYTGEDDSYESFSSDSSSGSSSSSTIFGCMNQIDVERWEKLYSIFNITDQLDEMQMLFYSKALVRLHEGFCLEEGYVKNVLQRFLPSAIRHLYSNTVKYMIVLILQSYESVHSITGKNDAMAVILPALARATRIEAENRFSIQVVENASNLISDMLLANQADRLGAFTRQESGVYLSKYFIRDQFGTIRGFESTHHGYHNFLQYTLLEELATDDSIVEELFENAVFELTEFKACGLNETSSAPVLNVIRELLRLCKKYRTTRGQNFQENNEDNNNALQYHTDPSTDMFLLPSLNSSIEVMLYNIYQLESKEGLWDCVMDCARATCYDLMSCLKSELPSTFQISLAQVVHIMVQLSDTKIDDILHKKQVIPNLLSIMLKRPKFDMLLIHIIPTFVFILQDADGTRSVSCPLTADLLDLKSGILHLIVEAYDKFQVLKIHLDPVNRVLVEVLNKADPSDHNKLVAMSCKKVTSWIELNRSALDFLSTAPEFESSEDIQETSNQTDDTVIELGDDMDDGIVLETAAEDSIPPAPKSEPQEEKKSSHYFKNVLNAPVFKTRLSAVMKAPEKANVSSIPYQQQNKNSSRLQYMFKIIKDTLGTTTPKQHEKKVFKLHAAPCQTEVLIVDTSRGDDITNFVYHDAGVHVTEIPSPDGKMMSITAGYMFKNGVSQSGHRHIWERYFFVLDKKEGTLSYYISETHAKDRIFVRGTVRPKGVSEGIPISVSGTHEVYGLQINTQGHGVFLLLVDSIVTRLTWTKEILACLASQSDVAENLHELRLDSSKKMSKKDMKEAVTELYECIFGVDLKFSSPLEAPPSFCLQKRSKSLSNSCVLSTNLPECVPYWGEFHGYEKLCDYWKIRDETLEKTSGRVLRILVDEDEETVMVMTSSTFRILRNSQMLMEESCDIITMSAGKVVSIHCIFDSNRIAEAFQREGVSAS